MNRMLAFFAALLMTAITVTSACVASDSSPLRFTLEAHRSADKVQLSFRRSDREYEGHWSTSFRTSELAGLDLAAFRSSGSRPLRFAIAREAGRVDCSGTGGNSMAMGTCSVTPDAAFNAFLEARGVGRPTDQQSFGLISVNARRQLVDALRTVNYPVPTVNKLIELSALDVSEDYIRGLASVGYRPASLSSLVEFKALDITPDYIGAFLRAGYSGLSPSDLVQLKALDITPAYVASFEKLGYGRLPASTLVQLKALDITPEFVRAIQKDGPLPPPDRLVMIRAVSRDIR